MTNEELQEEVKELRQRVAKLEQQIKPLLRLTPARGPSPYQPRTLPRPKPSGTLS